MRLIIFNCLKVPFRQNGFTLTEAMVAVSIIGILAVTAATSYFTMRPTRNMHADGRQLISELQQARLEAVKRNTCVGIELIPGPAGDLTGVANRGSYVIFLDDGAGTECDGVCDNPACAMGVGTDAILRTVGVRDGVALTRSSDDTTGADNNYTDANNYDLFDSVSFNSRALVTSTPMEWKNFPRAVIFRNDPNPANATWYGRVVINSLGGSAEYQTNDIRKIEGNWSE